MNLSSFRVVAPVALVAALVGSAVVSGTSSSRPNAQPATYHGPVAQAAGGGGGTIIYPSAVNLRLVRSEDALNSAMTMLDQGQTANISHELDVMQTNMLKAWEAAVYVIKTTPPPPAAAGAVPFTGGAAPTAAPPDTGFAVLGLQHDIVTGCVSMIDTAPVSLLPTIRLRISATLNARDRAVAYIHSIAPPPVAGSGGVRAHAGGGAVGGTWDTVMPGVVPQLGDENLQVNGTPATDTTVVPALKLSVKVRNWRTKRQVNAYWPPVPAG